MRLQTDSYSCGVYAIINAARCLGIDLKRRNITKFSKTTKESGTSEKGIINALKYNNLLASPSILECELDAFKTLKSSLQQNKPAIISVDNDSHWCVVIGTLGEEYIIFDSDYSKNNKKENGIHILSSSKLNDRWANKGKYYCIVVSAK